MKLVLPKQDRFTKQEIIDGFPTWILVSCVNTECPSHHGEITLAEATYSRCPECGDFCV